MEKKKRAEHVNKRIDKAVENLMGGHSCSEAVLLAYCGRYGLDKDLAFKIAGGFGGGMGLMGETCGAVTAAFMIIGLQFGAVVTTDMYSRERTYELVAEFSDRFKERYGSTHCRVLTADIDMASPAARARLREAGRVPRIVGGAVEILEQIFHENP